VSERIGDAETGRVPHAPASWSTRPGGGKHLLTSYEHDWLGRTTTEFGPGHTALVAGTAESVRRATWSVYKDAEHEEWTAQDYLDVTSGPEWLINDPVAIVERDACGNVLKEIEAVRAGSTGRRQLFRVRIRFAATGLGK